MMSTPKGSSFFSMAKKAPDTAKENVPQISINCKKLVWIMMLWRINECGLLLQNQLQIESLFLNETGIF
jgi:hypothetical protein